MPEISLDWLEVFPDLRVPGVPGVPAAENRGFQSGTPEIRLGVPGVPNPPVVHPVHLPVSRVYQQKTAENRGGTPGTLGTPIEWDSLSQRPGEVGEWSSLLRDRATGPAPSSVTIERWEQVLGDVAGFLETWGTQAVAMGWTAYDLFAVPPGPERWLRGGLVALLRGRKVVAITADAITIANPKGEPHRYRRNPNPGAVMLWDAAAFDETYRDLIPFEGAKE